MIIFISYVILIATICIIIPIIIQNKTIKFSFLKYNLFSLELMEGNGNSTPPPPIKLESFQSALNYGKALLQTPFRLMDRVTARSMDVTELVEAKQRSEHEMKKTLTWWDLIWFGMGGVIGAGIFVFTGLEAKTTAGPAVVLSYVVSGISAMLSVFCYTEFAVEIPVAGESSSGFLCLPLCCVVGIDSIAMIRWVLRLPQSGTRRLRGVHSRRQHPARVRDRGGRRGPLLDVVLRHSVQPRVGQVPDKSQWPRK